jgi:hypothetical protein
MRPSGLAALLVGIVGGSPAAAAPFNFHCSAPPERSSQFWQDQDGTSYRLRGEIRPRALDRLPDEPRELGSGSVSYLDQGASVTVGNTDENFHVILGISAGPDGRTLEVGLASLRDGRIRTELSMTVAWQSHAGISIPFEFTIRPEEMVIRVDDAREIRLHESPELPSEIRFGCSGGEFLFSNIEISRRPDSASSTGNPSKG